MGLVGVGSELGRTGEYLLDDDGLGLVLVGDGEHLILGD